MQNPYLYDFSCVSRAHDYVFIRHGFANMFPGKKMTNGFSYLKKHRKIYNYFLPTIYQSDFGCGIEDCIGYYARDCRIQSNMHFGKFLETVPKGTKVVTMGTKEMIEDKIPFHVDWIHTYDNKKFWGMSTHYFYYRCSDIEDPLPHTLLEAIQSQHRVISPRNKNRNFKDGIDDLLSCIDYDETFVPNSVGPECEHLKASNWERFMNHIAFNEFAIDYPVNRRSFREWIEETL